MNNILCLILTLIYLSLSFVFAKNALHMFQQNRYEFLRYTKWLFSLRNLHFSYCLIYLAAVIAIAFLKTPISLYLNLLVSILFAVFMIIKEEKKEYIKPLVLTDRVKRQIAVYAFYAFLFTFLFIRLTYPDMAFLSFFSVFGPYLLIYLMAITTKPLEEKIKKHYEDEARTILNSYDDLIKIGITGSYGKTTTKNVINDILSDSIYTLITPASYNTPMGITRTIREQFKPIYEAFVCEMGADHVGEITYLMDFVKPKYGIVTSIGPQHLNTFGSLDAIISEKMQEIEMLPEDGVGFINVDNEYIAGYEIKNRCKVITLGIRNTDADYVAEDIRYSPEGTSFKVKVGGRKLLFKTILLGEHNVMNILCGIALAKELGLDNQAIKAGVLAIHQVSHRLEIKKINGFTFIDNAFNSNPVGCKRSLEVLSLMPNTRVIVTPGLIDLGKEEDNANEEFGTYMKERADFVILVGDKNTRAIRKGLKESMFPEENILVVSSVKEAFTYIYGHFSKKDVILLENDLPDAFLY